MEFPPRHLLYALSRSLETTQELVAMCKDASCFRFARENNHKLFCSAKFNAEKLIAAFTSCAGYVLQGLTDEERQLWNNILFKCSLWDDLTLHQDEQKTIISVGLQLEKMREENGNLRRAVFKDNGLFISKENFKKIEDTLYYYESIDEGGDSPASKATSLLQDIESGELHNER